MEKERVQLVVIGAGSTGAAVAWDAAMRGIDTILLDRGDLASGTTGKCHGMLHSGARYAVKDKEGAIECIEETKLLDKIAPHVLEKTGGLFVGFKEDAEEYPDYKEKKLEGCKECGIPAEEISVREALEIEPNLNPEIVDAIWIPHDGTLHPCGFVLSLCLSGKKYGADIRPYNEVIDILKEGDTVIGVRVKDHLEEKIYEINSDVVVSAAGPWADPIAEMAGVHVPQMPTPGVMVVVNRRVNNVLINHLRPTSDGDIIVPHHTTSVIGTTSWPVKDPDKVPIPKDHVKLMLEEGIRKIPAIEDARILRAYAACRPTIAPEGMEVTTGRELSRTFEAFDHEARDGVKGFVTITGGKMCTARGMAEQSIDLVCKKIGIKAECHTREAKLVGAEEPVDTKKLAELFGLPRIYVQRSAQRWGALIKEIFEPIEKEPFRGSFICTDEFVTRAEIEYSVKNLWAYFINDIRRRTRTGMGTCQGGTCSYQIAGILAEEFDRQPADVHSDLMSFLKIRFLGDKTACWGDQFRQWRLHEAAYSCLGNYDKLHKGLPFSMPIFGEAP